MSLIIALLRQWNGDCSDEFAEQYKATELARLHTEEIRLMLLLHRSEHGC
jgi:hypothetical protein